MESEARLQEQWPWTRIFILKRSCSVWKFCIRQRGQKIIAVFALAVDKIIPRNYEGAFILLYLKSWSVTNNYVSRTCTCVHRMAGLALNWIWGVFRARISTSGSRPWKEKIAAAAEVNSPLLLRSMWMTVVQSKCHIWAESDKSRRLEAIRSSIRMNMSEGFETKVSRTGAFGSVMR